MFPHQTLSLMSIHSYKPAVITGLDQTDSGRDFS